MRKLIVATAAAAFLAPAIAHAESADARWLAFIGCWRPVAEGAAPAPDHIVCVQPEGAGVAIATFVDGVEQSRTTVVADGAPRRVEDSACAGSEIASWSGDGRRVYLRSDLVCEGGLARQSFGVLALATERSFIDVQAVGVEGEHTARTLRYAELPSSLYPDGVQPPSDVRAVETARLFASSALRAEDVIEASRTLPAEALDGLLAAKGHGMRLDRDRLVQLHEAGVAASTLDVIVALSYPERFAVAYGGEEERENIQRPATHWGSTATTSWYDDPWNSRYRYSRFGYGGYYYSPYGYDRYGWGYGTGPVIIVDTSRPDNRSAEAVKGRGYSSGGRASGAKAQDRDDAMRIPLPTLPAAERSRATGSSSAPAREPASQPEARKAKPRGGH